MNFVCGDNPAEGATFDAGVTAAATTGVDSDVPGVESSAHPSPTALPLRASVKNHVCRLIVCCLISLSPSVCRMNEKQARPSVLAPELSLKPRVRERANLSRSVSK